MGKSYVIPITLEEIRNSQYEENPVAGAEGKSQTGEGDTSNGVSPQNSFKRSIQKYVAVKHFVAPYVSQFAQYQIGTVSLRTGSSDRQQRLQATYNLVSQGAGLVESVALGAMMGGGVGAIIGGLVKLSHIGISMAQQSAMYDMKKNLEDTTLSLMNFRAGGAVSSSSQSRR
jgi:hypothetical protein